MLLGSSTYYNYSDFSAGSASSNTSKGLVAGNDGAGFVKANGLAPIPVLTSDHSSAAHDLAAACDVDGAAASTSFK
jgi:hypothetical protein